MSFLSFINFLSTKRKFYPSSSSVCPVFSFFLSSLAAECYYNELDLVGLGLKIGLL